MSKYIGIILAINRLLLTKYALERRPLQGFTIVMLLSTGWMFSLALGACYIILLPNNSIHCVPFFFSDSHRWYGILLDTIYILSLILSCVIIGLLELQTFSVVAQSIRRFHQNHMKINILFVHLFTNMISTTIPVIVLVSIAIIQLTLRPISQVVYGWLLITLIPCGMYVNPFLHTFSKLNTKALQATLNRLNQ